MPIAICSKCGKPTPDSFHRFSEICSCHSIAEWKRIYKKHKWSKPIFPDDTEGQFIDWAGTKKKMKDAFDKSEEVKKWSLN